jgi:uncharacterized protein YqeY
MRLQEQIKKDLVAAMKEKDEEKKSAIRVIMGEFGRLDKKELADEDVIRVLKKLIKSEREMLDAKGETTDSPFITILEKYLPGMASEDEIRVWIQQNVDFTQFNNKMQAMKPIMSHFGSSADGNLVKKILQSI